LHRKVEEGRFLKTPHLNHHQKQKNWSKFLFFLEYIFVFNIRKLVHFLLIPISPPPHTSF
jgi:hypothetical protein